MQQEFQGHIQTLAYELFIARVCKENQLVWKMGKWCSSCKVLLVLEGSVFFFFFSVSRCGLRGVFLQEFLASVQITHKRHLSETKACHLPLRGSKNVLTLLFFMSFNVKCLFYPHRGPDFFQRTNSLPMLELAKPAAGLEQTEAYLSASTPSLHLPTLNLFPTYTKFSLGDLARTGFVHCCSSNRAEQQTMNLFSTLNHQ